MKQIFDAVEHMHAKDITHRDLKLENIALDEKFNPKIIDFGFADETLLSEEIKGTSHCFAPEIYISETFETKPLDVFSLGVFLFILITGNLPFLEATGTDRFYLNF